MTLWARLVAFVLAGSTSCTFITDTCACTWVPPSGVVYGTVSATGGGPVGALITLQTWEDSCDALGSSNPTWNSVGDHPTAANGNYRAFARGSAPAVVCVQVTATSGPKVASGRADLRIGTQPTDSVRVDLALP